jgi:hypothetical protein
MSAIRVGGCHQQSARRCSGVACAANGGNDLRIGRRALVGLLPLLIVGNAQADEPAPFLKSLGGRGFLADEEEAVLSLRKELESGAREQLERERSVFESEARRNQRGLYVLELLTFVSCSQRFRSRVMRKVVTVTRLNPGASIKSEFINYAVM